MSSADPERQGDGFVPEHVLPRPGPQQYARSLEPGERVLDVGVLVGAEALAMAASEDAPPAGALATAIGDAMDGRTVWLQFHGQVVAAIVPVRHEGL